MSFGWAGAGEGAAKSLEEIVAARWQRQILEQEVSERQKRFQLETDRFNESKRSSLVDEGQRQQTIDGGERSRRDQNNERGLRLMQADKGEMDFDAAIDGLPEHAKPLGGLLKAGVLGKLSPDDLRDPAAVSAEAQAKKEAEFNDWKRKQDYDEQQIRNRPKEPKPSGPGGLSTAQGNTALKFQDDYARDSKPYLTMRDAFQRVQSAAAKPDAAGDLSMIFAYMKMLDPNSVVREQEFANAQNATGVPDQIRNTYNRVVNGNRLNEEQRQQFVAQAQSLFQNAKNNHAKVRQTYGSRAKQWEIPESMVLDAEDTAPDPAAAAAQALIDKARAARKPPS